jgi:predicted Rossmann fold flavoprotein
MNNKVKVAIIGGGPAGMMAAIQASGENTEVVLFEKNSKLGRKLLVTGKGRCNITNAETDVKKFLEVFGRNGRFLYSAFAQFFNEDLLNFFRNKGLDFVVERGNRVFPKTERSLDVLKVLEEYLQEKKVKVLTNHELVDLQKKEDQFYVKFKTGEYVFDKVVLATGGKSFPGTGSTGEVFQICQNLGCEIIDLKPSLIALNLKEKWIKEVEGLALKNVEASIYKNHKKILSRFGEMLFTAEGVSGPIILSLSKYICRENPQDLILSIDFKPALNEDQLRERIRREMNQKNIIYKNLLKLLLPGSLVEIFLEIGKIDRQSEIKHLNKKEINSLINLLKNFKLHIKSLGSFYHAIVSAGGINIKEIDPRTMESKKIPGLYFVGEMMDIDAETGGYNLQAAFSTGYLAGNALKEI